MGHGCFCSAKWEVDVDGPKKGHGKTHPDDASEIQLLSGQTGSTCSNMTDLKRGDILQLTLMMIQTQYQINLTYKARKSLTRIDKRMYKLPIEIGQG